MNRRRISLGDVVVGQPLPWNVYNDKGILLLAEGASIQTEAQLDRLLDKGIYIESTLSWHQPPDSALQNILHACYQLAVLLRQPELAPDFKAAVAEIVALIQAAYARDPGVVMATVVLRRGGRYSIRHAVNAACVAVNVLHAMGNNAPNHGSVLAAALTMNIGMIELHDTLARQAEPLTLSQQARVHAHPLEGMDRLVKLGVNDEIWLRAVAEHHEAIDGSGYPQHLRGPRISPAAQLLGLADLFCARVSERGYRRADSTKIVLRDVLIERGHHFDAMLAAYFIKALGVYPIGTLVQLKNGVVGVVSGHTDRVDTPRVHGLLGVEGMPLAVATVYDTREPQYRIVDALSTADVGVPIEMESIWGREASDFSLEHHQWREREMDFSM
ncbi:HD-GYP domain-containing protein [Chitinimonas koreensis]|uniref:HD-GYP domain-containing protein n=1 Tax=Chitinimonas koreensis TaxID=356302 RepID=UPI00041122CF|nr:HD domain-containing phosphohydrolase [Chitinimonas koreensis]QNM94693.1 hypothetical protein H9L41_12130 [Chitinimonas koreensis]